MTRSRHGLQALLVTALALQLVSSDASAVVLDFNDGVTPFTQDYGDIPGLLDVSHAYQNGTVVSPLSWWGGGYDELVGVAWGAQQAAGTVGRLTLAALDPSQPVVLRSFQLGSWEGSGLGRVETVTITRLGEAMPAFTFTGVIGANNLANMFSPDITSAAGMVIEWSNPWWTAIDNVDIGLAPAVPEPGAALLMPLGLLGLAGFTRWRRRAERQTVRQCPMPLSHAFKALLALLTGSTLSVSAHAGLSIEGQFLSASALVTNPLGQTHGNTWFWDSTLGLPVHVVSSGIQSQGMAAAARQTPDGFFSNEVRLGKPWEASSGLYTMTAATEFSIAVVTDTPDTPLILDFHFLGSTLAGGAYYGSGRMTVGNEATISGRLSGAPPGATWGFQDQLLLDSSTGDSRFTRQSNGTDVQGIGLPLLANETLGWREFQSRGAVDRLAFAGQLDFGLLQPGEVFRLDYEARSWIEASISYAGDAHAELIDPFSLGGTAPVQLQLRGLTLPVAVVPEPASAALLAAGLALLATAGRRRIT